MENNFCKFILCFFIIACIPSCEPDEEEKLYKESLKYAYDNIEFQCDEIIGETYFKGKLKGKDFCICPGVNDYEFQNAFSTTATTPVSNPVLNSETPITGTCYGFSAGPKILDLNNGIVQELKPIISIHTPINPGNDILSISNYLEICRSKTLNISNWPKEDKVEFNIYWHCVYRPGYKYYLKNSPYKIPNLTGHLKILETSKNDSVKLLELTSEREGDKIKHTIKLEFNCDMYFSKNQKVPEFYGRLEGGIFSAVFYE